MLWMGVMATALAQESPDLPPPPVGPGSDLPPGPTLDAGEAPPVLLPTGDDRPADIALIGADNRTSQDMEIYVRRDGNLYVGDEIVLDRYLPEMLEREREGKPDLRVVVVADPEAGYARVSLVLRLAQETGARVATVVEQGEGSQAGGDPLFPGLGGREGVTELGVVDNDQIKDLKPKRWKFPQNPYASTDFTAYTLEWGEAKIGLGGFTYGIAPRIQLQTNPLFDAVGVLNGTAKANLARQGPLDFGVLGQAYFIPVDGLLNAVDEISGGGLGLSGSVAGEDLFLQNATLFGVGGQVSLRLAEPWSLHGKVTYLRVGAKGNFNLIELPDLLIPGLTIGGDNQVVPRIQGDLVSFQVATDVRFNRRDSLVLQFRGPIYAGARGAVDGSFEGINGDLDFIVAYSDYVSVDQFYAATLSWQLQWKHFEARVGAGISDPQFAWIIQAFDLSYRFGGKTRKDERTIRKGFKENVKDLESGGDQVPEPTR